MSEADGGFEGVAIVGSNVVGSTTPEYMLESTQLPCSLMCWFVVVVVVITLFNNLQAVVHVRSTYVLAVPSLVRTI